MVTTRNIKKVFRLATQREIVDGQIWYTRARKECQAVADQFGMPLHIVVGVVSALSPNNKWERNVVNAVSLCDAFCNGDAVESVKVSTYNTMRDKAWRILESNGDEDEVLTILNGPKIKSFFKCIMGYDECCIDGHARNIAYNERIGLTSAALNISPKEYVTLGDVYRKAAKQLTIEEGYNLKPYEVQAITWVAWRRIHNIT